MECFLETLENLQRQIRMCNSQLEQARQQLDQEITGRKRAEQITHTLFRISNAVNTTKDLGELYASIHLILGEIIDLSNFYIALYHKQSRRVSFPYFVDQFDCETTYTERFSEDNSLTGEVLFTGKPLFLNQADLQQRNEESRIIGTAPIIWLGVPLKIKEEVIGIMATQCYHDAHHFDRIDLDVLHSVSAQVALAIERKRFEQAIVTSEKKYRNIIKSIDDGYYEIDVRGKLTLVNQALCRMLGSSELDLLDTNFADHLNRQTAGKVHAGLPHVHITENLGKTLELEFQRSDGQVRYAETIISVIRSEDGDLAGYRGIARDITDRKAAERSRQALEEQLRQSQRLESLGTLAGGIAHDFNNLLMGIEGRTSLMLNELTANHPHYTQLRSIEEYVASATNLTTRLLGFAQGGKYEVRPINLNTLIEKSIEMFGRTKKEITISTALQSDLWPIEADISQIEQVLLNLMVNAAQAMAGGGFITIATSRIVLTERDVVFFGIAPGNYVELTISDTGEGMDDETMQKIFDPFFTTKAIGHGTGLGLAMVYGIIRNHAGGISVKSVLNKGTIFTIFLPATDKEIIPEISTTATAQEGSETVLLVDDEPMIIDIGQEILTLLGYNVLTAASGREALEVYSANRDKIDLVIIDMIMPEIGGGELYDRLKQIHPAVRVLLCSGYSIDGQAREILDRGCKGFIQKPYNVSQLSIKIREALR